MYRGQEKNLSNATLYRVSFPEFWETAYAGKNAFFQKVAQDATRFVECANRGHEFLEGDKIQHFWHEHCAFCWEKALTDKACEFYCTEDMKHWICAGCFRDLHEKFNWQVRPAEDLFR